MTLFDNLKKLGLRAASTFLKPLLTDDNKKARLEWALRWVSSSPGHGHKIQHFEDFVHIAVLLLYCCNLVRVAVLCNVVVVGSSDRACCFRSCCERGLQADCIVNGLRGENLVYFPANFVKTGDGIQISPCNPVKNFHRPLV